MGDHEDVPAVLRKCIDNTDPLHDVYPTDVPYATIKKNSFEENLTKARIPVSSNEEAMVVVNKIINYELHPPLDNQFYKNGLVVSSFEDKNEDGTQDCLFVETSEEARNTLIKSNYDVERVYSKTSEKVCPKYYMEGASLPKELLDCSIWNGTADSVVAAINKGKSIVVYNGHGNYQGWTNSGKGLLRIFDTHKLTNKNILPVILSVACQTARFDEDCFAEKMLRIENGGAIGVVGYTDPAYSPDCDRMGKSILSSILSSKPLPVGKAVHRATDVLGSIGFQAYTNKIIEFMHYISQYIGDPSIELWTDVPTCFAPTFTQEGNNIIVNTNGVGGCKITLCSIEDLGESRFETVTLNDSTTSITFEDVNVPCYITINKHNYIPFIAHSGNSNGGGNSIVENLYLQNRTITENVTLKAINIYAGEKVSESLAAGPVAINGGTTKLLASNAIVLKPGFSVKGGNFIGRITEIDTTTISSNNESGITLEECSFTEFSYNLSDPIQTEIIDNETEMADEVISIYPNPTNGVLFVQPNNDEPFTTLVETLSGKTVLKQTNQGKCELNLSSFEKGIYFVRVISNNESIVKKVILQ